MAVYACRLNPARPDFPQSMTPAEADAMAAHAAYWSGLVSEGVAIVVGPVMDPAGLWGLAVVDVPSHDEAERLTQDDPVIRAKLGLRYDILSVPQALVRPLSP